MLNPTPKDIKAALRDWVPERLLTFRPGWKDRGRPWSHGIRAVFIHHWAGTGDGGQAWMEQNGTSTYPYANCTVRRGTDTSKDGQVIIMSALSAWHSGSGGPWPRAGIPRDSAHLMAWGVEMEGPLSSTRYGTDDMTDAQWESTAAVCCAIREVAGSDAFPNFQRVIRHADWTDGTAGVDGHVATPGRKNDVWRPTADIRKAVKRTWVEAGR